jgi:hypothetical protein
MARKKVTWAQMRAAIQGLGIDVPVRAAVWRGAKLVLRTRAGEFSWTPPARGRGQETGQSKGRGQETDQSGGRGRQDAGGPKESQA